MGRALDLIRKLEYLEGDVLGIHLDRFLNNIKSLAKKSNITITTDLEELRISILTGKLLKGHEINVALSEKASIENRTKTFKVQYKQAVKAFIGILKSLKKNNKLDRDIRDIVAPFLKLEVGE